MHAHTQLLLPRLSPLSNPTASAPTCPAAARATKESAKALDQPTRLLLIPGGELDDFVRMLPGLHEAVLELQKRGVLRQCVASAGRVATPRSPRKADEWTVKGYRELMSSCHWTTYIMNYTEPVDSAEMAAKLGIVPQPAQPQVDGT